MVPKSGESRVYSEAAVNIDSIYLIENNLEGIRNISLKTE